MTKEEILDIFKMVSDLNKMTSSIYQFITDKKNSFEDRLEIFLNTPKQFYTSHPWILHLPAFDKKYGDDHWFEDFFFNRHENIDLTELIANKEERCEDWSDEKFRAFQEAVLKEGVHEFTLDW